MCYQHSGVTGNPTETLLQQGGFCSLEINANLLPEKDFPLPLSRLYAGVIEHRQIRSKLPFSNHPSVI